MVYSWKVYRSILYLVAYETLSLLRRGEDMVEKKEGEGFYNV
jgi:hypothetical protein